MADDKDNSTELIRTEGQGLLALAQSGELTRRGLHLADSLLEPTAGIVIIAENDDSMGRILRHLFRSLTKCVWFKRMEVTRSYFRLHASEIRLIVGQQNQPGMRMSELVAWCHEFNSEMKCIVTHHGDSAPAGAWESCPGKVCVLDRPWTYQVELAQAAKWAGLGLGLPVASVFRGMKLKRWPIHHHAVVIVCDNSDLCERLRREHVGFYYCFQASTAAEAQHLFKHPSLETCLMIVTDFQNNASGSTSELLQWIRSQQDDLPVLSLSDCGALRRAGLLDDPMTVELPKNASRRLIQKTLFDHFFHSVSLEGENEVWPVI